jgi:S-(hydroxymethyl)mycothiol dehydrogenase
MTLTDGTPLSRALGIGAFVEVAVIGCGGVGNAAVLGARLAGARTIIAVDIGPRKLEWRSSSGRPM